MSDKELLSQIKSLIKSASNEDLSHIQEFVSKETNGRRQKSGKINRVTTYTDGAARGNPGPAGVGVLLFDEAGEKILQDYQYLGETTNNEAEYRALMLALDRALEITREDVECFMDSELLCRQMTGVYSVKSDKLRKFHEEIKSRAAKFHSIKYNHVRREDPKIKLADQLANRAIDEARPKKEVR